MVQATIYTQDGNKKGTVDLPEHLFTLPWAERLVHQVVVGAANNRRAGTAHTKERAEVRGGGRKPWRQKGTGRARHGSIRSPLWVGGGVTFGPNKKKDYSAAINKKMRAKAFFTVLSQKARTNSIIFIDSLSFDAPSTKKAVACIEKVCADVAASGTGDKSAESAGATVRAADNGDGKDSKTHSVNKKKNVCTIVFPESDEVVRKSFANVRGVNTAALDAFNTLDAFNARTIVFINPDKTLSHITSRGERVKETT